VYKYKQLPLDSLLLGLKNGSIDVGISPLTITSERSKYIDFSAPYFIAYSGIMTNYKSNYKRIAEISSTIFSLKFLKIIGYVFFIIAFFGFLVWLFERNANKDQFGGGFEGLLHGIWWSAVTMTTVGYGDKTPKTFGGRVISLLWMFIGIILISTITASITSTLTIKKMEVSSEEINSYKNSKIGTVSNSATETWLTDNFYFNTKSYHNFDNMIDGLRNKEIEMIAYDEPVLRYEIRNDDKKEFELMKVKYNLSMYAFGFNKQMDPKKRQHISLKLLESIESSGWKRLLGAFNLENND
jgi:ABC-type amino acid transport substrate-binding protein